MTQLFSFQVAISDDGSGDDAKFVVDLTEEAEKINGTLGSRTDIVVSFRFTSKVSHH